MTLTRQKVTDLLTPSVTRAAELVRVDSLPVRNEEQDTVRVEEPVRECFTRVIPTETTDLQTLVRDYSHHLCVCAPSRADMMAASAEMKAHPDYPEYKARRDAAMGRRPGG